MMALLVGVLIECVLNLIFVSIMLGYSLASTRSS